METPEDEIINDEVTLLEGEEPSSVAIGRPDIKVERVQDTILEDEILTIDSIESTPIEPEKPNIPVRQTEDVILEDEIEPLQIENKISEIVLDSADVKETSFDEKVLEDIRSQTEKALSEIYKDSDVKVIVSSHKRNLKEQADHYLSGASKTPVSLHNFGLAGDFLISIDGKLVTGSGGKGIHGSKKPYQVLGHFAKEKGLFWGWKWDSGHVGKTRFVTEALKQNPTLADSTELKILFDKMIQKNELPKSLKGLIEELGSIYNKKYNGNFTGKGDTLETLLEPIKPEDY